jgi:hypothetical protein
MLSLGLYASKERETVGNSKKIQSLLGSFEKLKTVRQLQKASKIVVWLHEAPETSRVFE